MGVVLLCKDDLFQIQDVCHKPDVAEMETDVQPLMDWWEQRIPDQKVPMDLELMQEIVGKYVGLLSTVTDFMAGNEHHRLRHLRDCVCHTSSMFQQQVLNKSQLQALGTPKERPVRAHFSGPPGSGKTLLLVLEARTFLADSADHQVVVLNMYRGAEGRAIGKQIYRNIKGSSGSEFENRVFHLQFDVNGGGDFDAEVNNLLGPVARKEEIPMHNLMFVVDEIYVADFWKQILVSFDHGFAACHVLTAGLFSSAPPGFAELELEVVHRCPPSVQNLLFHVDWKEERRRHYVRDTGIPEVATNGPTPLCIRHQLHVAGDGSLCYY
nr:hypothetical protein BaRGS_002385 [Batillaria attramentaria]